MKTRWLLPFTLATLAACGSSSSNTPPPPDDVPSDTKPTDDLPVGPDVAPDVAPDVTRDTSPDVAQDASPDASPDKPAPVDVTPDVAPDATVDVTPDVAPDATVDVTPDVAPDATVDVSPDVRTDASSDASSDAASDVASMCSAPVATIMVPGAPYMRDGTTSGASRVPSTTCQSNASGPEDVYTLMVTARSVVTADTLGMRTAFDTILSIRRDCNNASSEVACNDDTGSMLSSRIRTVLEPGTYALIVDGYSGRSGAYALAVRSATPAANGTCMTPATLAPGSSLMGQNTAGASVVSSECSTAAGPQLFYSVTVPANSAVTVQATPTAMSGLRPVLRVKDSCAATTCVATGTATAANANASVILSNASAMPRTFIVSAADFSGNDGTFNISASMPTMLAANANCATPTTLAPGASLMGQNTASGGPRSTECATAASSQLYYQVTVPPMSGVTVTATPTGMPAWTPVLRVRDNCMATTCSTTGTATAAGMPASVALNNASTSPRTFVVSVAGVTEGGTFNLAASMPTSLVPGATCESPILLTPMAPAMNVNAGSASSATPNRCQPGVTGPQTYFSVTIPPRQRATFRATPTGMASWAPTIRVISACSATTCLDSRVGMMGMPTVLAFDNPSAFPLPVLVSVAGASPMAVGTFDMTVALADLTPAAQYTFSTISRACDDVSMGTAISPVNSMMMPVAWADDSASPVAALPFTVQFNGAAATHFSVTSNGFLQLYPNAMGMPSTAYSNATIPSTSAPNGYVAPFWDDLTPNSMMTTAVRTATLGTAPNRRFVVQWTEWSFLGDSTSRLTFQAKLFETTNVIEFHYCTMNAAMTHTSNASGSSATIGVENAAGDNGFLVAFNRMGTVSTANAFRLTPR